MFSELIKRVVFWHGADRLGPDMLATHWRLYFKSSMTILCQKKFKKFGENSEFRPGAYAEACSKIEIGNNVVIRPGTFLYADATFGGGEIIIEDDVLLGGGIHFYTNNHKFDNTSIPIIDQGYPTPSIGDSIRVQRGSWIGANAVILPGVTIGKNSVVGAGSIVTKSVPPRVVVAGNPAKILRQI
jgi:acetyltransferase-like isoleucine patch superfamily enzyme